MELSVYDQQMKKSIAYLEQEFAGLQVGRATTGLVDNLNVETEYGVMKLNTLAHITVMDTTRLSLEIKQAQNILLMQFTKQIWELD